MIHKEEIKTLIIDHSLDVVLISDVQMTDKGYIKIANSIILNIVWGVSIVENKIVYRCMTADVQKRSVVANCIVLMFFNIYKMNKNKLVIFAFEIPYFNILLWCSV